MNHPAEPPSLNHFTSEVLMNAAGIFAKPVASSARPLRAGAGAGVDTGTMDDDDDLFGVFDLEGVAATGTSNAPTAAPAAATPSAPRTGCASSAEPPGGVASASATPPPTPSGNGSSTSPRPPPPDNSTPTATADSAAAASAAAAATGAKPLPLPLVLSVSFSQHPLARRARAQVLAAIEQVLHLAKELGTAPASPFLNSAFCLRLTSSPPLLPKNMTGCRP